MKIAFINGSPKVKDSASGIILEELKQFIDNSSMISEYFFRKPSVTKEEMGKLSESDALVFAFPLYVDGIPSHLLRCLMDLEEYFKSVGNSNIIVYALVNSGFYEGEQNKIAIEMMENWCEKAGLIWGQGIGVGAGMMMHSVINVPTGQGPKKDFGNALRILGENISKGNSGGNLCITANFPKFLYRISGNFGWIQSAKKNGLKKKDLSRRV